jgi:hypothetical protein
MQIYYFILLLVTVFVFPFVAHFINHKYRITDLTDDYDCFWAKYSKGLLIMLILSLILSGTTLIIYGLWQLSKIM